jgi:hypothetical protein
MNNRGLVLTAGLTGGVLMLSSCASDPAARGHVYREWSDRMAEMGIFPVYPPREDIAVGDVYALPLHPYDSAAVGYIGGLGNAGIHVEYLGDTNLGWNDLLARSAAYYSARPYAADSTNTALSGTNVLLTGIPGYEDGVKRTTAFGDGSAARLRQVSFPDFSVTHIDQESMAAVIPIEGIMAGFSFNRNDIRAVHFSIPHAESYGLTTEELLREVYQDNHFKVMDGKLYLRGDAKDAVISLGGAKMAYGMFQDIFTKVASNPEIHMPLSIKKHMLQSVQQMTNRIYLALISEVYFARSMDITIERKTATGASASARPITVAELGKLKDLGLLASHTKTNMSNTTTNTADAQSGTNTVSVVKADAIELTDGQTAFDLADKLRKQETPGSIDQIGGSVRVLSVSANNIGLRRTFQRPIAIGVRGVLLKLDLDDVQYKGVTQRILKEERYQTTTNVVNNVATISIVTNQVPTIVEEPKPWIHIDGLPPFTGPPAQIR